MTDLTPAEIAALPDWLDEGDRLLAKMSGGTSQDIKNFQGWMFATGPALLTAARDAARYREALELIWPFFEGEHYYDHPDSVKVRAALAGEREG